MFTYLRLISIISLLVVTVIVGLAGMYFRNLSSDDMVRLIGRNNASLTQGYVNAVWKRHNDLIAALNSKDTSKLKDNPQIAQFAQDTVRYFQQMPLVRVNLYNKNGVLLLTSNVNPISKLMGAAASPDNQFVFSHIAQQRASSNLLKNVVLQNNNDAVLVQTLVPIRDEGNPGQESEGSVELLYDVTAPWNQLFYFQLSGTIGMIMIFLVFVAILFVTSEKAESIISKQHETNLELAATAAEAQAENREKSQFLANVSHELRTPLNAIIGFSEIMKNEVLQLITDTKYQNYINDIHSAGVHLLSLINDILDYSKAEAGKLELEVSEVNATKMVQNSMRLISPRAEVAQVRLIDDMPKDQFIMITDSKKFKQILLNLLSNAVKFTPAGGEVRISGWQNVADDTFSFEVSDTGIGIAPKDISRAMAPFGQVDNSLSRKYEGTGLGLPLTKKFVELMGGKFSIESHVNIGTKITFILPREVTARDDVIIKQLS